MKRSITIRSTWIMLMMALVLCFGCQGTEPATEATIIKYFDLGSLIEDQIAWLDSLNPKVKKLAVIDGQNEEQIDTIDWETELVFFKQSDLNRPYLLDTYGSHEINENKVKKTIYQPLDSADLGVVQLVIHSDSGQLKKIESVYQEQNLLYDNWRKATMDFALLNGEPRPITYQVEGWQKVIFKDKVDYLIRGEILY
ncbi:MAG: hypothetical protein ACR2MX_17430 [Cyclobacteriaceae bacterium]